jgi:tetratricopeptide (TPR) repeat protein
LGGLAGALAILFFLFQAVQSYVGGVANERSFQALGSRIDSLHTDILRITAADVHAQSGIAAADKATLAEAIESLSAGDPDKADATLDELFTRHKAIGFAYLLSGDAAVMRNDWAQALRRYDQALAVDSMLVAAWHNRGVAFFQLGRLQQAVESATRAIELAPDNPHVLVVRGRALNELGRCEEAIRDYDQSTQLLPSFAEAWDNRGVVLCECLHDCARALKSHEKASRLKPEMPEAWYNRGNALRVLTRYAEAESSYAHAVQLRPSYWKAWSNLGAVQGVDQGNFTAAIQSLDHAVQLYPASAVTWFNRGFALQKLERLEEAHFSYGRAVALDSSLVDAWLYRAGIHADNGSWYEALTDAEAAVRAAGTGPLSATTRNLQRKLIEGARDAGYRKPGSY